MQVNFVTNSTPIKDVEISSSYKDFSEIVGNSYREGVSDLILYLGYRMFKKFFFFLMEIVRIQIGEISC